MQLEFIIGDISGDGYDRTEKKTFEVNVNSKEELMKAYARGSAVVRFDLIKDECNDYEEWTLSDFAYKALDDSGFGNEYRLNDDSCLRFNTDVWFEIFFHICRLGLPNLVWKENDLLPCIDLGGYGLLES